MGREQRPLLFIAPYSDSLTQLRSVCLQIAKDENIEVMDIENIQQLHEVMANYGPALMLYSSPKKCAMGLQQNHKIIKKVQAKTVLITDKIIPAKTLDQFMKLGLTDCITEPISPKSLLYKIKLLIRSLPSLTKEEAAYRTISSSETTSKIAEKEIALNSKKGALDNENIQETTNKTIKAQQKNVETQTTPQPKQPAEILPPNLKGELREETAARHSKHPNEKKDNPAIIETHYKGDIKEDTEAEDSNMTGKTSQVSDVSEHEIENLQQSLILEAEAEALKHDSSVEDIDDTLVAKAEPSKLIVEDDYADDSNQEDEAVGSDSYYKPKRKRQFDLEVEDDTPLPEKGVAENPESHTNLKKKHLHLEVEESTDQLSDDTPDEEKEIKSAHDKFQGLDIEDDTSELSAKDSTLPLPTDEPGYEHNSNENQPLEVQEEKSRMGSESSAQKNDLVSVPEDATEENSQDDIITSLRPLSEATEEVNNDRETQLFERPKNEIKQEAESAEAKESQAIAPYDSALATAESQAEAVLPLDEGDDDQSEVPKLSIVERTDPDITMNAISPSIAAPDGIQEVPSIPEQTSEDLHGHGQRADYIEKYYNQKKHEQPESNQSWDGLAKQDKKHSPVLPYKLTGEKSLIIAKPDLAKQSIHYNQIKDTFAALDNSYSHQPTHIEYQSNATDGYRPPPTTIDENGKVVTIYFPNSKGIEHAIRALYIYSDKDTKDLDVLTYLGKTLHHHLKGRVSFLSKLKKRDEYIELFNGHLQFCSTQHNSDVQTINEPDPSMPLTGPQVNSRQQWEIYKLQNLDSWSKTRLPSWSDETFQKSNLTYVYPYYENTDCMGFAIIDFADKFDPIQSALVEILCESARSIFIYNYHKLNKRIHYLRRTIMYKNDRQLGMFISLKGLFGKKAG